MTQSESSDSQAFTQFSRLPLEIQSAIWAHCLPQRQIVNITVPSNGYRVTTCYSLAAKNLHRLPQVAYVCREAHRVALKHHARRKPFTITDDERQDSDGSWGVAITVPFDPTTDVVYMGAKPDSAALNLHLASSAAPHLATLLQDRRVQICVPSSFTNHDPEILRQLSRQGRKTFHVALGSQFVIHMTTEAALQSKLFGITADDTTVMIEARKTKEIAPYELAHNRSRSISGHADIGSQIANTFSKKTWVGRYQNRSLPALADMAEEQIRNMWADILGRDKAERGSDQESNHSEVDMEPSMPIPIPVVLFRLCTRCARGGWGR